MSFYNNKLVRFTILWKPVACLYFTGMIVAYAAYDLIFQKGLGLSAWGIFQVMAAAAAASVAHILLIGEDALLRWPVRRAVAVHAAFCYLLAGGLALAFGWVSFSLPLWGVYTGGFLAVYLVMIWGFGFYYGVQKQILNDRLADYKAGRGR